MVLLSPYSINFGKENAKNYPYFKDFLDICKKNKLPFKFVQVIFGNEAPIKECDLAWINPSTTELKKGLCDCKTWISIDNFMGHLGAYLNKPGVVIFGPSDPRIFGYLSNMNLFKYEGYFRPDIYGNWISAEFNKDAFIPAQELYDNFLNFLEKKGNAL
jgi:hypothetical protein